MHSFVSSCNHRYDYMYENRHQTKNRDVFYSQFQSINDRHESLHFILKTSIKYLWVFQYVHTLDAR